VSSTPSSPVVWPLGSVVQCADPSSSTGLGASYVVTITTSTVEATTPVFECLDWNQASVGEVWEV